MTEINEFLPEEDENLGFSDLSHLKFETSEAKASALDTSLDLLSDLSELWKRKR